MPATSPARASIDSRVTWNDTGIDLVAGGRYHVEVSGTWSDASHATGPEGWDGTALVNLFSLLRRAREFKWFALVGSIDRRTPFFHIMPGVLIAPASGRLYGFANDAVGFYFNNHGSLELVVTRMMP